MSLGKRAERFDHAKIEQQVHGRCDLCGKQRFTSGFVEIERSYIVTAACGPCAERAARKGMTIGKARMKKILSGKA